MRPRDERGFALPVTVLLIALITVMLTSGFVRVRADRQVAESQEVSAEALSIARSGIGTFLDAQSTRPPNGLVDTMYVTGGYAIVTANIIQNPADTLASQTWIIRATGYVIDPGTGATPRAQRSVAQFAEWQTGAINIRGAITMPNGLQWGNRGRVTISGNDYCGSQPTVLGIRTAGQSGSQPSVSISGGFVDEGNPADSTVADQTDIDWQDILDGAIIPDQFGAPPVGDWSYPITMYTGNLSMGTLSGSGLLIVTGNLTVSSLVFWQGIILVGGRLVFNSSPNSVYGAVVTGLNELTGGNPQATQLGWNGAPSLNSNRLFIYYDSCTIRASLSGLTGFAPIDNAWVDNWATY